MKNLVDAAIVAALLKLSCPDLPPESPADPPAPALAETTPGFSR